jgi:hypothetical protein
LSDLWLIDLNLDPPLYEKTAATKSELLLDFENLGETPAIVQEVAFEWIEIDTLPAKPGYGHAIPLSAAIRPPRDDRKFETLTDTTILSSSAKRRLQQSIPAVYTSGLNEHSSKQFFCRSYYAGKCRSSRTWLSTFVPSRVHFSSFVEVVIIGISRAVRLLMNSNIIGYWLFGHGRIGARLKGSSRRDGYPLRLIRNNPPTTAARTMLALSASTRITSNGTPNSSRAMLPVSIAAPAAVANTMTRTATLTMSLRE